MAAWVPQRKLATLSLAVYSLQLRLAALSLVAVQVVARVWAWVVVVGVVAAARVVARVWVSFSMTFCQAER
jgi:hypothetical protein